MSVFLIALATIGMAAITAVLFAFWILLCGQVGRFLVYSAVREKCDE